MQIILSLQKGLYLQFFCGRILNELFCKEDGRLDEKKVITPMEHLNIGEFNRGQSSKLIRGLAEKDSTAFILKNGKPIAVLLSYERYERLLQEGIDINNY